MRKLTAVSLTLILLASLSFAENGARHEMSAADKAEYERISKLPPAEREKAFEEFKTRHGIMTRDRLHPEMSAADKAEYERISKLPPAEKQKAIQEYIAKHQKEIKGGMGTKRPTQMQPGAKK